MGKKLLIIVLLALPVALFGQLDSLDEKKDTVWIHTGSFDSLPTSATTYGSGLTVFAQAANARPVYRSDAVALPQKDTVAVILIVIDTNTGTYASDAFYHPLDQARNDRRVPFWIRAFTVRERHNTSEGVLDAGGQMCTDREGHMISCWTDYMKHLYYLDEYKRAISKEFIIIQSVSL